VLDTWDWTYLAKHIQQWGEKMAYKVIYPWEFDADMIAIFDLIDSEDPTEAARQAFLADLDDTDQDYIEQEG
jgi:hypothetical protein